MHAFDLGDKTTPGFAFAYCHRSVLVSGSKMSGAVGQRHSLEEVMGSEAIGSLLACCWRMVVYRVRCVYCPCRLWELLK